MPNIFDYAFAPDYAKTQDQRVIDYLEQMATSNAIGRSYENAYNPKREEVSSSEQVLKDPNTAFITNLLRSKNPGAVKYATELYSNAQNRSVKGPSYSYQKDDMGNLWAINNADPRDRMIISRGKPENVTDFSDKTMNERMLSIVANPEIGATDPRRLAARRWLGREKNVIDPATGAVQVIPGLELYGIDPYLSEPAGETKGVVRTKDQIAYDSFVENAYPMIEAFNNYARLVEEKGPAIFGKDAAELKGAGMSLLLLMQKFNEFGVLNEGDVIALNKLIGSATSVEGIMPGVLKNQIKQLKRDLQTRLDAKQRSFEGTSVKTRELPRFMEIEAEREEKTAKRQKIPDMEIGETITIDGEEITRVK